MGSVDPSYRHVRKLIVAGEGLDVPGAGLKWYDLHRPEVGIGDGVREKARAFVRAEAGAGALEADGELGFVILHRVHDAYLLLVMTWRNENELWETVYSDPGTGEGFTRMDFPGVRKGTYCVWELGVVGHEQQAWIRYLFSARDEGARADYLADRLLEAQV
ncbi:hypothetical protein [Kitasatospora sp. NPDC097643]|uniref:hypothetical protein n=1 Tax=Kitasatospora sp. NPDC097643 TaxID=3157230 RepID=UPI0033209F59